MNFPEPPQDIEQRKVIDKFVEFVARNGCEFENKTKESQMGNPKFAFLHGGEFHDYYKFRLSAERMLVSQENNPSAPLCDNPDSSWLYNANTPQVPSQNFPPTGMSVPTQFPPYHSEQAPSHYSNMAPAVVPPFVQPPIAAPNSGQMPAMVDAITEELQSLADQITQSEQNLTAQQAVLAHQQEQQTEEVIALSQHEKLMSLSSETGVSLQEFDRIIDPIIVSCTKVSISQGKQWIFQNAHSEIHSLLISQYLLQRVLDPGAEFSHKLHIIYLLNDVLHHCVRKNVNDLHRCLEAVVVPMFSHAILNANEEQKVKLNKLLTLWESKSNYFSEQILFMLKDPAGSFQSYQNDLRTQFMDKVSAIIANVQQQFANYRTQHEAFAQHVLQRIQLLQQQQQQQQQQKQQQQQQQMSALPMVDFSRPPPGFDQGIANGSGTDGVPSSGSVDDVQQHQPADLIPTAPYYDLPAGLIQPLVGIDDHDYKPIDPAAIRLPPPLPPSEQLLAAVEAFYAPPDRGRGRSTRPEDVPNRRDRDGWEQLGLYEFFKAKNASRRQKANDIEDGLRDKSPPLSPISSRSNSRSPSPEKPLRRYSSVSPERDRPAPVPADTERERTVRRRSRSRSRSRSPVHTRKRSSPGATSPRPSRRRSLTPPAYAGFGSEAVQSAPVSRLDESNRGHQLLRAMGWGGAGLGSQEQGIAEPISGGEVRDRQDKFKGVGVSLHDPFENFRKNKGQAFVTRMRARAEETAALVSKGDGKADK